MKSITSLGSKVTNSSPNKWISCKMTLLSKFSCHPSITIWKKTTDQKLITQISGHSSKKWTSFLFPSKITWWMLTTTSRFPPKLARCKIDSQLQILGDLLLMAILDIHNKISPIRTLMISKSILPTWITLLSLSQGKWYHNTGSLQSNSRETTILRKKTKEGGSS